jgi:hypothetical protein
MKKKKRIILKKDKIFVHITQMICLIRRKIFLQVIIIIFFFYVGTMENHGQTKNIFG